MGELNEKAKGLGNTIAGKTKEIAGEVTGNRRLETEGELQQVKGKVQNAAGDVAGKMGDKV